MLEAEIQARIFSLYWNEKKSIRKIAELVGVDRKTVKRIIDRKQVIFVVFTNSFPLWDSGFDCL
jgi:predicted DNA-binding protein YlxM (UPF0122 family)